MATDAVPGGAPRMEDLQFPHHAERTIESLQRGLEYDAATAVLGLACADLPPPPGDSPDFRVPIRLGDQETDAAVRRDAPQLLARLALISMVSRTEHHALSLLLQRRVIEEICATGQAVPGEQFWKLRGRVHRESRQGPVALCSQLVVTRPSPELLNRMEWLGGIVRVRNCIAHRLGQVNLEDVTPRGATLGDPNNPDTLRVVWPRLQFTIDGAEVTEFPHHGGGQGGASLVEETREWKVGERIDVTPHDCQAIAMSLSFLANQLLADFVAEMESEWARRNSPD